MANRGHSWKVTSPALTFDSRIGGDRESALRSLRRWKAPTAENSS